jgi:hypothetical protein
LLKPILPAYDIADWKRRPFPERLRMVCQAWAEQGYGSPASIYLLYLVKIAGYIGVWVAANAVMPGRDLANIETWWASPEAFGKAIVWTMLFEGLGLGCGSGPLTGRYVPPIGGALYFLRPGTTKLPLLPGLLGHRRTLLDVLLYALVIGLLVRALLAPALTLPLLLPILVLVPLLGVLDKTLFLVFRSEHYLSSMVCLCFPHDWIAGNKVVWLAIWWWAATSKLNAHFPAVMCVMTSNAPWTRVGPLRRWMYRDFPHDLRPSRFAAIMAHVGTVSEYLFPLLLVLLADSPLLVPVLLFGTGFHLFIMSNVPMGVPLEWNVIMIYGAWALFGAHADVGVLSIGAPALWAWLLSFHLALPMYGSLFPAHVSFLLSMRYYAGNWAYSVWLFAPSALEKLEQRLTKWSRLPEHQLGLLYDEQTIEALLSKVVAFRAMHLHGRALHQLLPLAVDDLDRYTWLDGEIVAGMVVGWNFGDGHLHDLQLLNAMQAQCHFEPGELRCIFVESQPLLGSSLAYVVADAHTGVLGTGQIPVSSLVDAHPWPAAA